MNVVFARVGVVGKELTIYTWRIVDYRFIHCGARAIERAKRIDLYLTSERKTIM